MKRLLVVGSFVGILVFCWDVAGQRFRPNYDEAKVPEYKLPDPLVTKDGRKVETADQWREERRPEILELFKEHVYGHSPSRPKDMTFKVTSVDRKALGGKAVRKEVTAYFTKDPDGPKMHILMYLPGDAKGPVPIFVGLNFWGNHSVHSDAGIRLSKSWMRSSKQRGIVDHRATEKSRGQSKSRWPIEKILARGYGVATIYCGDIDPDFDDGFQNGVHPLSYEKGQKRPGANEWGTIAAWAWGLSRALDYFEQDKDVDASKVIVLGHSRLGKTALWAGARDARFAMVISNNSGCGGAALSRRAYGETVGRINASFPHWFCQNFHKYSNKEGDLPVDQHMLVALIAPRPVYIASAVEDRWADPRGEFLSAKQASPVYRLLGEKGVGTEKMPKVNEPIQNTIGYHVREGGHDVKMYDWKQYLDFADKHLKQE